MGRESVREWAESMGLSAPEDELDALPGRVGRMFRSLGRLMSFRWMTWSPASSSARPPGAKTRFEENLGGRRLRAGQATVGGGCAYDNPPGARDLRWANG